MAFDPATDLLRVITRDGSNYRVSPTSGTIVANDTRLAYFGGVPRQTPDSVALASARNGSSSTLYSYTFNFDEFVTVGNVGGTPLSANSGQCFVVGGSATSRSVRMWASISRPAGSVS